MRTTLLSLTLLTACAIGDGQYLRLTYKGFLALPACKTSMIVKPDIIERSDHAI